MYCITINDKTLIENLEDSPFKSAYNKEWNIIIDFLNKWMQQKIDACYIFPLLSKNLLIEEKEKIKYLSKADQNIRKIMESYNGFSIPRDYLDHSIRVFLLSSLFLKKNYESSITQFLSKIYLKKIKLFHEKDFHEIIVNTIVLSAIFHDYQKIIEISKKATDFIWKEIIINVKNLDELLEWTKKVLTKGIDIEKDENLNDLISRYKFDVKYRDISYWMFYLAQKQIDPTRYSEDIKSKNIDNTFKKLVFNKEIFDHAILSSIPFKEKIERLLFLDDNKEINYFLCIQCMESLINMSKLDEKCISASKQYKIFNFLSEQELIRLNEDDNFTVTLKGKTLFREKKERLLNLMIYSLAAQTILLHNLGKNEKINSIIAYEKNKEIGKINFMTLENYIFSFEDYPIISFFLLMDDLQEIERKILGIDPIDRMEIFIGKDKIFIQFYLKRNLPKKFIPEKYLKDKIRSLSRLKSLGSIIIIFIFPKDLIMQKNDLIVHIFSCIKCKRVISDIYSLEKIKILDNEFIKKKYCEFCGCEIQIFTESFI